MEASYRRVRSEGGVELRYSGRSREYAVYREGAAPSAVYYTDDRDDAEATFDRMKADGFGAAVHKVTRR